MTSKEYENYWIPAKNKFCPRKREYNANVLDHIMERNMLFAEMIGVDYVRDVQPIEAAEPELLRYLQMLLGPHGHTLLKMKKIRDGIVT